MMPCPRKCQILPYMVIKNHNGLKWWQCTRQLQLQHDPHLTLSQGLAKYFEPDLRPFPAHRRSLCKMDSANLIGMESESVIEIGGPPLRNISCALLMHMPSHDVDRLHHMPYTLSYRSPSSHAIDGLHHNTTPHADPLHHMLNTPSCRSSLTQLP